MRKYQITFIEGIMPSSLPMAQKISRRHLKKIQTWRAKLMGLTTVKNSSINRLDNRSIATIYKQG